MKRISITLLLVLYFLNLYSQHIKVIGSRFEKHTTHDFIGLVPVCNQELDSAIIALKSLLKDGSGFNIFQYNLYPSLTYLDKEEGLSVMGEIAYIEVNSQNTNYLLFLVSSNEKNIINNIKVHLKIENDQIPSLCKNLIEVIESKINNDLKNNIKKIDPGNLECYLQKSILYLINQFEGNCTFSNEDLDSWFSHSEYEEISLTGINVFRVNSARNDEKYSSRTGCGIIDYTGNKLHYTISQGEGGEPIANYFARSLQEANLDNVLIFITDFNTPHEKLTEISDDLNNKSFPCEKAIHLHFRSDGKAKIKYASIQGEISYEIVKSNYKAKVDYFNGITGISFRFKQKKDEIIAFIHAIYRNNSSQSSFHGFLNNVHIGSIEFFAGVIAGFADGMIELVDLAAIIGSKLGNWSEWVLNKYLTFQVNYNIFSSLWFIDMLKYKTDQRSYLDVFKLKFGDTMNNWASATSSLINKLNSIFSSEGEANPLIYFLHAIIKQVKDFSKDIFFLNGPFNAGYAAGLVVFEFFPPTAAFGKAKGALSLIQESGQQVLGTMANNIAKNETKERMRSALLTGAAKSGGELLIKMTSLKADNLVKWFKDDMNDAIKSGLLKWIDKDQILLNLNSDIIKFPNLKKFLQENKIGGLNSWRHKGDLNPCF
jgi:hypothetical protein